MWPAQDYLFDRPVPDPQNPSRGRPLTTSIYSGSGLLGGDDKVCSRLAEVAKADQLTIADPWFWLLPSIHPSFLDIYLNQMLELKLELSAHFTLTFKLCGHFSVRVFINIVLGTCVLHLCAILSLCY